MVRTLAVVFALVIPLWFLGQASPGDGKRIRPIDPVPAYQAFRSTAHGPTPSALPEGWTATVADYTTTEGVVRVGYVVGDHYLEFLGSTGTAFLEAATGHGRRTAAVRIGGRTWESWESSDGVQSLVLRQGQATVVVGGVRETASTEELTELAALVR